MSDRLDGAHRRANSNGSDDDKLQMKACLAKQRQANPQSLQDEMRRKCAKLKPTDPDSH